MSGILSGLLASLKSAIAKVYFVVSKGDSSNNTPVQTYIKTVFDSQNNYYSFYSTGEIIKRDGTTGEVIWVKREPQYNPRNSWNSPLVVSDGIWFIGNSVSPGDIIKIDFNGNVLEKRSLFDASGRMLITSDLKLVRLQDYGYAIGKGYVAVNLPEAYDYATGAGLAKSSLKNLTGSQEFEGYYPNIIMNNSNTIFASGTGDGGYGTSKTFANVYKYNIGSTTAQRYLIGNIYGIYNISLYVAPANSGNYYVNWTATNGSGSGDANIHMLRKITSAGQDSGYTISGFTDGIASAMVVDSSETYLYAAFGGNGSTVVKIVKFSITGTWSIVWQRDITINSGSTSFTTTVQTIDLDNNGDLVFGVSNYYSSLVSNRGLIFAKLKPDGSQVGTFAAGSGNIKILSGSDISISSGGSYGTSGTVSTVTLANTIGTGTTTSSYSVAYTDVTSYYNSTAVKSIL